MGGTGETSGKKDTHWDAYFHLLELNLEYAEGHSIEEEHNAS